MKRLATGGLLVLSLATFHSSQALAQDGPLRQIGRALDNTGKNIRYRVESEVARGEAISNERDVLTRVSRRIAWDKQMVGTAIRLEVRADGSVVVSGTVPTEAAKKRAIDLVENTIGVTSVVDMTTIGSAVKVVEPGETRVIRSETTTTTVPTTGETRVIRSETKVVEPAETKTVITTTPGPGPGQTIVVPSESKVVTPPADAPPLTP
jgi:hypothetical protein